MFTRKAKRVECMMIGAKLPALPFLDLEAQRERKSRSLAVMVTQNLAQNVRKCPEDEPKSCALELQIIARRRMVIEYKKLGLKIFEIQQAIFNKTGVMWSEKTIRRDLSSVTAEDELEELKRQQDRDIALESDSKVRMEMRDRQIERLMPRKSPEVQINTAVQVNAKSETKMMIDFSKMSKDDQDALLRAEEALTRAESAAGPK
jgi:hypothetical protein